MKSYTVTEFTKSLKYLIENNYSEIISITGEVSNLAIASSGHYYFVLKDGASQISMVMFRTYAAAMRSFKLKNGDKIQALGNISVYEAGGSYQMLVKKIEYDSEGDLWQQFIKTKQKLENEGLFDDEKKRPIPQYPSRIALLTSISGAAIKDFIHTVKNEGGTFNIDVWNIPVQGTDASKKIVETITKVGKMVDKYDAIVVTRGGGSFEDLSVFNSELVARAISHSSVPTISAIGHERDVTISDYVADYKAVTPTASAVFLSSGYRDALKVYEYHYNKLVDITVRKLQSKYQHVDMQELKVKQMSPINVLSQNRYRLEKCENNLRRSMSDFLSKNTNKVNNLAYMINSSKPTNMLNRYNVMLEMIDKKMLQWIQLYFSDKMKYVDMLESKLKLVNPSNILDRGYAIVYKDDRVVSDINDVKKKEIIEIKLKDGHINSSVIDVFLEAK